MTPPDIFLFAGEVSGDLHGSEIIAALLARNPHLKLCGVGGPKMRAYPFETILPMEDFQVMGFLDVFLALPTLFKQFHLIKQTILSQNPPIVLFIDYPGFNLRLARSLRKGGFKGKLIHYICPSVWAWGKKRIPLMAENLTMLLSILPFEKDLFSSTSLPVHYVGNPLLSHIEKHTPPPLPERKNDRPVLGLFPGSRSKEIERNLPKQLTCARRLLTLDPTLQVALSVANPTFCSRMHSLCAELRITPHFIPSSHTYDLMHRCTLALATSGTVTLELALHQVPTVVTYAISPLDLFIAKHLLRIRLPHYSLPNIIASAPLFPELIGPHLTDHALFHHAAAFLTSPHARQATQEAISHLTDLLESKDAATEAACAILSS